MLFETALDYVVRNEFENLISFNNNILATRQHSAEIGTSYGGTKAALGFPSAAGTRKAQSAVAGGPLALLALPRGFSSPPQCFRPEPVCTSDQQLLTWVDRPLLDLQKEWKPQCLTVPFSVLKHAAGPVRVLPSSQGKVK